ncbi:MAG: hypothetical protein ACD_58C00096G0003 [uncultured bacterium]|nr:MAG: hypothetical protein ACD_58C00096G0003 [uncultured bacterium]
MMKSVKIWQFIFIIIIFFASIVGYLLIENQLIINIIIIAISLIFSYLLIFKKQFHWIFFLTVYLSSVSIYFLSGISSIPLWVVIVILLVIVGGLSYLLVNPICNLNNEKIFYCLLIYLASLEIFFVILPWSISVQSKGLVFLTVLYFYWGLLELKTSNNLSFKSITPYLVNFLLVIIVIISFSSWIGY